MHSKVCSFSVIVFVLLITLTGTVTAAPPARAKWTVMVYISGDNNLEDYVVKDIELELAPRVRAPMCRWLLLQIAVRVTIRVMGTGRQPSSSM